MIVGAFLAESASAVDNKLNVSGGVLFRYTLDAGPVWRGFCSWCSPKPRPVTRTGGVDVEIWPPTDDEPLRMPFELPAAATHRRGRIRDLRHRG
ncbi:hypothetical protein I545_5187 [Mycobacterium kansasii 662]|uniref:Uncharacterized protein n=1 Tax=Mycobacterium kansasii 662 TaxID=1299326 RepID=X7YZF9_MYCKA|nr:hypothetical protein I545_5187 [Mycobacterium kansasii 662]